jgi:aspartokinase/homoserine dehydrogenase 1
VREPAKRVIAGPGATATCRSAAAPVWPEHWRGRRQKARGRVSVAAAGDGGPAHLLVLGKGNVGGRLLELIAARRPGEGPELRVVGLADRGGTWLCPDGLPADGWREGLPGAPRLSLAEAILALAQLPRPVLVDCTPAGDLGALYARALERGLHVVTANKKPLAGEQHEYERLTGLARRGGRRLGHETTVGAALPVLRPLQDLLRTGDAINLVEGSLSGTLGYLCDELTRGTPLSRAVAEARQRGYTEPLPQEDLSGADVARKAVILAREIGLSIEPDEVQVEPLVPAARLAEPDADRFVAGLRDLDESFAEMVTGRARRGQVIRYLARVAPGAVQVGPVWVEAAHPAARLRHTECLVAVHSQRYREVPLCIQGPGAGGLLTASGVLADILDAAAA